MQCAATIKCLWSPAVARTVGFISRRSDGSLDSPEEHVAEIIRWFPDAVEILRNEECSYSLNAPGILPPHEVPFRVWEEMLEVLPPMNYMRGKDSSSFMMSEYWSSNITRIFARIGSGDNARYFEMRDVDTLSHDDIVAKCMGVINEQ